MRFTVRKILTLILFAALSANVTSISAAEKTTKDEPRGKLLYNLHCISCHNEQIHWQKNKKVSDWPSLVAQVKLWQNISGLKWEASDIDSVARHLNNLYYHYPVPNTVAQKK